MKLIDMTCPHCCAVLKVDAANQTATCEYCGAVLLINDEVSRRQSNNGKPTRDQSSAAETQESIPTSYPQYSYAPAKKKRRTWLWVLGWIFIFPVPLTILLVRNKEMKPALKIILIILAWLAYFAIGRFSNTDDTEQTSTELSSSATEYVQIVDDNA